MEILQASDFLGGGGSYWIQRFSELREAKKDRHSMGRSGGKRPGTSLKHQETEKEPGRQHEDSVWKCMELCGRRRACWAFELNLRQAKDIEVERMKGVVWGWRRDSLRRIWEVFF